MRVYFHLNSGGVSNCYIVANEKIGEAVIVDPGIVDEEIINQLEENSYKLVAVLVTHNHGSHVHGIKTLSKIYSPKIFGVDWELARKKTNIIAGDGKVRLAGMTVQYITLPGHTPDSVVYKIGNVIFTGDSLSAGIVGSTNSSYSEHMLEENVKKKILAQQENTIIMPGHGPPTTVRAECLFNRDIELDDMEILHLEI